LLLHQKFTDCDTKLQQTVECFIIFVPYYAAWLINKHIMIMMTMMMMMIITRDKSRQIAINVKIHGFHKFREFVIIV